MPIRNSLMGRDWTRRRVIVIEPHMNKQGDAAGAREHDVRVR
jgi:hypothetical protein